MLPLLREVGIHVEGGRAGHPALQDKSHLGRQNKSLNHVGLGLRTSSEDWGAGARSEAALAFPFLERELIFNMPLEFLAASTLGSGFFRIV